MDDAVLSHSRRLDPVERSTDPLSAFTVDDLLGSSDLEITVSARFQLVVASVGSLCVQDSRFTIEAQVAEVAANGADVFALVSSLTAAISVALLEVLAFALVSHLVGREVDSKLSEVVHAVPDAMLVTSAAFDFGDEGAGGLLESEKNFRVPLVGDTAAIWGAPTVGQRHVHLRIASHHDLAPATSRSALRDLPALVVDNPVIGEISAHGTGLLAALLHVPNFVQLTFGRIPTMRRWDVNRELRGVVEDSEVLPLERRARSRQLPR